MNRCLIGLSFMILAVGLVSAQTGSGSFGEYASGNPCGCLLFNTTNTVGTWTLVSTFNTPLPFNIIAPSLAGVSITTSINGIGASNGIIPANSILPITVTVSSNSPTNQTGYLTATATAESQSSNGPILQISTSKLIKITGLAIGASTTTISGGSGNSGNTGNQGAGGPSGGSFVPTIVAYANGNQTGYRITNITQHNSETLRFNSSAKTITINLTVNFVGQSFAGITANNRSYNLTVGNTVELATSENYTYYARLTNVSYLPILHTITLLVYGQSNSPAAAITTTKPTTTATTTVQAATAPTTTVAQQQKSPSKNDSTALVAAAVVIIIAVVVAAAALLASRRKKNRP